MKALKKALVTGILTGLAAFAAFAPVVPGENLYTFTSQGSSYRVEREGNATLLSKLKGPYGNNSAVERVVAVETTNSSITKGGGTGYMLSPDYMITANHVVEAGGVVSASSLEEKAAKVRGTVVARDWSQDLALVKLDAPLAPNAKETKLAADNLYGPKNPVLHTKDPKPLGPPGSLLAGLTGNGYEHVSISLIPVGRMPNGAKPVLSLAPLYERVPAYAYQTESATVIKRGMSGSPVFDEKGVLIGLLSQEQVFNSRSQNITFEKEVMFASSGNFTNAAARQTLEQKYPGAKIFAFSPEPVNVTKFLISYAGVTAR